MSSKTLRALVFCADIHNKAIAHTSAYATGRWVLGIVPSYTLTRSALNRNPTTKWSCSMCEFEAIVRTDLYAARRHHIRMACSVLLSMKSMIAIMMYPAYLKFARVPGTLACMYESISMVVL